MKILDGLKGAKYVSVDTLFRGFFFFFIYKDIILREIISYVREFEDPKFCALIDPIERDY
jgi:hypothetical protein